MKLFISALIKFLIGLLLVGLLIFLPAGTMAYPGGILFLLGWWFFWLFFYIAVVMIPIGLVIYIYGTSGSTDENTLQKIIKERRC